jgi:hypothetical protein
MNLLGREHRIYFVLSSYVCFLSGAHEGQWDAVNMGGGNMNMQNHRFPGGRKP